MTTETKPTLKDRYDELSSIISDLESKAKAKALAMEMEEYCATAGNLITLGEVVIADGHASEIFDEVMAEAEQLQSDIDQLIIPFIEMAKIPAQAEGEE